MAAHTHTLAFTLQKVIGELSEKRLGQLMERDYQLVQKINTDAVVFLSPDKNEQLILSPNNITCTINMDLVENYLSDPSIVISTFEKILDILLLDPTGTISIQVEQSYDNSVNTFNKSWEFLNSKDDFFEEGAISIAFRIPIILNEQDIRGDIKIEPFIADASKYFVSCALQTERTYNLDQLTQKLNHMIRLFRIYEDKAATLYK